MTSWEPGRTDHRQQPPIEDYDPKRKRMALLASPAVRVLLALPLLGLLAFALMAPPAAKISLLALCATRMFVGLGEGLAPSSATTVMAKIIPECAAGGRSALGQCPRALPRSPVELGHGREHPHRQRNAK